MIVAVAEVVQGGVAEVSMARGEVGDIGRGTDAGDTGGEDAVRAAVVKDCGCDWECSAGRVTNLLLNEGTLKLGAGGETLRANNAGDSAD